MHEGETVGQERALYDINGDAAGSGRLDLFPEISAFPAFLCQYGIRVKPLQQPLFIFSFMEENEPFLREPVGLGQ